MAHFGTGIKLGLKNGWNRGIAFGLGFDWTTHDYFRANILIDLDFLFQYSIDMGNGKKFSASCFTKFVLSKILVNVNGISVQEYYFRFNIMQFQFGHLAFSMGQSKGLFRKEYSPHFADKGLVYTFSYIFKK
jgi:hypothetical protein